MAFPGVTELAVQRRGDVLTLRPARPSWESFFDLPKAGSDFLAERPTIVEPRRVSFGDGEP
jgi:antitoxin VapB